MSNLPSDDNQNVSGISGFPPLTSANQNIAGFGASDDTSGNQMVNADAVNLGGFSPPAGLGQMGKGFTGQVPPRPPVNYPVKPTGMGAKEKEVLYQRDVKEMEEVRKELELSREEKEAGVETISETIELPEKIKKESGVETVGPTVAVPTTPTMVTLPLDDQQIKLAKKANIMDSLLWLAYWCMRQLKLFKKKEKVIKSS